MIIKFTGEFNQLMSMGFSFHKLYANNYRVYHKHELWIFVKGRSFEYSNLPQGCDQLIMNAIVNDTLPRREKDFIFRGVVWTPKGSYEPLKIDTQDKVIHRNIDFMRSVKDKDHVYDYQRYREFNPDKDTCDTIIDFYKRGWLEI